MPTTCLSTTPPQIFRPSNNWVWYWIPSVLQKFYFMLGDSGSSLQILTSQLYADYCIVELDLNTRLELFV